MPSLGILAWQGETNEMLIHPSPLEQIRSSIGQITGTIHALFARKSDIGVQQLGGAVMIIRVYSNLFEAMMAGVACCGSASFSTSILR